MAYLIYLHYEKIVLSFSKNGKNPNSYNNDLVQLNHPFDFIAHCSILYNYYASSSAGSRFLSSPGKSS